ncbi:sirohydrochlorin cobaltochelatase [uncultured Fretibacterium sp.]|uniref:sirohydrochlorin cobaltochelatase n=1 Tax=uncultured Fretibacterium sp. TaxID=1678694 RepID=UPI0026072E37|nr:sirohydrochlorin cobaltochelatase [uncultured Fretibacterium sp.]
MMMKSLFAFMAFTVLFTASAAFAGPHGQEKPDRTGILIASFGTSMPEARKAIDNLVDSAKKSFPDAEVRLAFTSNIIRRKIAREQNIEVPTPVEALAKMNDEGFTHVYVMPTHIIPGEEYDEMRNVVDAFASLKGKYGFKKIELGAPYLHGVPDCDRMARILMDRFAPYLKQRGTAIVLMGHGTPHHIANAMYSQLQLSLDRAAHGKFFLGTVEAAPTIEDVIRELKRNPSIKKLVISPLMIVAGDHANNDLAGADDDESWLNLLKKAGYKNIETYLVGLGEDPQMANVFVDRIREMMR